MLQEDLDPERVEEAKAKVAGPLGQEFARFPSRFCVPITIGTNPRLEGQGFLLNGSVTLVRLRNRNIGITCQHVLQRYREIRAARPDTGFQVGNLRIDPLSRLISESSTRDLVTLDMSHLPVGEMEIGPKLGFFEPHEWPPQRVDPEEFVTLAGYPGAWRAKEGELELGFGSMAVGLTPVTSVSGNQFGCLFEREYWVQSLGPAKASELRNLGGMSGGPVFIHRGLRFDWVGMIFEHSENYDILFARHADLVRLDGTLDET